VAELLDVAIVESVDEELADGGVMGYLRLAQALETLIGQPDEPAALVGRVRGSLDESGLLEFVDGAGDATRAEVPVLAELADRH
jgi:hypothetical protein